MPELADFQNELNLLGLTLDDEINLAGVKRAYAKRLKEIKQAQDPEGFQALNQAFKRLSAGLREIANTEEAKSTSADTKAVGVEKFFNDIRFEEKNQSPLEQGGAETEQNEIALHQESELIDNIQQDAPPLIEMGGESEIDSAIDPESRLEQLSILKDLKIELEDLDYAFSEEGELSLKNSIEKKQRNLRIVLDIIEEMRRLFDNPHTRYANAVWYSVFNPLSTANFDEDEAMQAITGITQFLRSQKFITNYILDRLIHNIPEVLNISTWQKEYRSDFVRSIFGYHDKDSLQELYIKNHLIEREWTFPDPKVFEFLWQDITRMQTEQLESVSGMGIEAEVLCLYMELDYIASEKRKAIAWPVVALLIHKQSLLSHSDLLASFWLMQLKLMNEDEDCDQLLSALTTKSPALGERLKTRIHTAFARPIERKLRSLKIENIADFPFYAQICIHNSMVNEKTIEWAEILKSFCAEVQQIEESNLWPGLYSFAEQSMVWQADKSKKDLPPPEKAELPWSQSQLLGKVLLAVHLQDKKLLRQYLPDYLQGKFDKKLLLDVLETQWFGLKLTSDFANFLSSTLVLSLEAEEISLCSFAFHEELIFSMGFVREEDFKLLMERVKDDLIVEKKRLEVKYKIMSFADESELKPYLNQQLNDPACTIYLAGRFYHSKEKARARALVDSQGKTITLRPSDYHYFQTNQSVLGAELFDSIRLDIRQALEF